MTSLAVVSLTNSFRLSCVKFIDYAYKSTASPRFVGYWIIFWRWDKSSRRRWQTNRDVMLKKRVRGGRWSAFLSADMWKDVQRKNEAKGAMRQGALTRKDKERGDKEKGGKEKGGQLVVTARWKRTAVEKLQKERWWCVGGEEANCVDRVTQRAKAGKVRSKNMTLIVTGEKRKCVCVCVYFGAHSERVCVCSKLVLTRQTGCDIN